MSNINRKVFESTFQNIFFLSVCTTIFKRIAGLRFYLKFLMLRINGFVLTNFYNFKFVFKDLAENQKNIRTNSEAWILIKVHCFIYKWIRLDKFYKLMESFLFKPLIRYWFIGQKTINIRTNREAFILIEVQCVSYLFITGFVSTCSTNLWKLFQFSE